MSSFTTGTFTLSLLGDLQRGFDDILVDVAEVSEVDIRHLTEKLGQPPASAPDSHHGQGHFVVGRDVQPVRLRVAAIAAAAPTRLVFKKLRLFMTYSSDWVPSSVDSGSPHHRRLPISRMALTLANGRSETNGDTSRLFSRAWHVPETRSLFGTSHTARVSFPGGCANRGETVTSMTPPSSPSPVRE